MEPNRKSLNFPGLDLSYLEWGTGEPVLLLHGLADHALVWCRLAEQLSQRFYCIAPDLRGHGESSKPPESEYRSDAIAADLEALVTECHLPAAHVVAHSWAAKIALIWARQHPERIKSLVLVDPFFVNRLPSLLRPTFPLFYRTLPFLKVTGPFKNYDEAEAIARTLKQYRNWNTCQQDVFKAGMEQKPDGTWGSKFAIAARNGVFEDTLQRAGLIEKVNIPTLLILPEQGLNRQAWQIRPYRQYLTQLQITSVPGNHWPHLVEPDSCNAAIDAFLQSRH
ncbi:MULTISPECIES: alpha/beta hydrolase [unclassified Leptolyngbya]|uniref:alpha/beta fold hydrolase n=1 Tax=unclassified Leptolyngbya TaxID=2650499 RepID=UPI0016882405|nr:MULTISPECIES: alpha/beta hydrolase [unclassified Leptolyngbya]MBD1909540.1 alpha/beta hydrolase [Leptolyngbya sp. FACHB-8]MBD2154614.1 alpha/beta hydrolase [Leptolyngbya sp. FACHB-16]